MRKLATVQVINSIEPISNADAIEKARVLGWYVVVKKGEFSPGDKVIYCEIDSLLPERPEFEFLRKGCFKAAIVQGGHVIQRAGFRIKTVKLRGQVSQGILFPMSLLGDSTLEVGTEVTETLGIIKHDPPLPANLAGKVKAGFPWFLPKTDEIRVQNLEGVLTRHCGATFAVTEKLDGTSCTAFLRRGEFGVCSRNLWLDEADETCSLIQAARRLDLAGRLETLRQALGFDVAIQGELIGPGIQGNKYARKEVELWIFNLLNIDTGRLVDRAQAHGLLTAMDLKVVPVLEQVKLEHTTDQLVEYAMGPSTLNPKVHREGLVFRPLVDVADDPEIGGRLSFKVINPQFLLKYED